MYSITKAYQSMIICRMGNNFVRNEAHSALRNISQTSQQLDITKEKEADTFGTLNQNRNERRSQKNYKRSYQFSKKPSHHNFDVQKQHSAYARNNLSNQDPAENNWHVNKTFEKWNEFREADYQKILKQSRNLLQDDDDDDFDYLFGDNEKDFLKDSKKGLELDVVDNQKYVASESDSQKYVESQNDIDRFGTLDVTKYDHEKFEGDEGDAREEKFQTKDTGRKHTPQFYGQKIRDLCKEKKLTEAIKVLEEDMINDGVKPNEYCYQVLINGCGRVGYTQKAFKLYNQMKKHGLKPHNSSYTALFDACANSPWKTTDGLKRAKKLKQQLDEAGYFYNQIVSHAMIKAFGRCGDIEQAFKIVDEMLATGLIIDIRTITTLLQACISDKEAGFRHALLAWRKMRELKLDPNIYTYNLLVHCTKECKGGDITLATKLLELPSGSRKNKKEKKTEIVLALEDKNFDYDREISGDNINLSNQNKNSDDLKHSTSSVESNDLLVTPKFKEIEMIVHEKKSESKELLPQLLARQPTKGSVIGLTSLEEPQNRLALLGGSVGLLEQMRADKVKPNLKTFTQLIDSLPPTIEAEMALLDSMKKFGLSPDTQFCNMLIRKRSFRFDKEGAEAILDVMSEYKLSPDLITFGCLALCCYDAHSTRNLLQSMDDAGCTPNTTIMTSLLRNCLNNNNYFFAVDLLLEMQERNIQPNAVIVKHLENARTEARKTLLQLEETSRMRKLSASEKRIRDGSRLFLMEWKNYLSSSSTSDLHDHPWAQYKRTKPDDLRM